jgi:Protein of unknown function (DUF3455)
MSWKATLIAALAIGLGGSAHAAGKVTITPPPVPIGLDVPAGFTPFLVGHAVGTQNYICAPAATPTGGDWFFLGPQATVYDAAVQQNLTHFLSKNPFQGDKLHATWQHSGDTSAVWATKLAGSSDPDYVAPGAIEWLLLEMTGAQVGPTGGQKLSATTFIQRVNTAGGGKPPAAECTASTINTRKLVAYEAEYYFYR